jgi:predicted aspartyl protease
MSHPYLDTYYPPMPALEIRLGYPEEALILGPLTAIVDTGADGTLIPQSLIDAIGAPFVDDVRVRSHWGEWRSMQLFTVDVGIGRFRLPAVEVVGDDQGKEIVLGRNVLNCLRLLLDGPADQVEVLGLY